MPRATSLLPHLAAFIEGAPAWLSNRVILCGVAAVVLLIVALFLRGLQKIVMIVFAIVLAVGIFWLIQDALATRKVLPTALETELDGLANRALESHAAKSAWDSVKSELPRVTGDVRERLAAGGDQARKLIATRLDAKAMELRKAGKRDAADELMRLKAKVSP